MHPFIHLFVSTYVPISPLFDIEISYFCSKLMKTSPISRVSKEIAAFGPIPKKWRRKRRDAEIRKKNKEKQKKEEKYKRKERNKKIFKD